MPFLSPVQVRPASPRALFDPHAAMQYVQSQLAFGPRVPGTAPHAAAGDWIAARLRARADVVVEQRWMHVTASGTTLPLRNILARFQPGAADRVLYVTHWDTRPIAEADPSPDDRGRPIPGANDGASGVALFLALADLLQHTPATVGLDLLFVDGEDYGDFMGARPDVLIGSTYFAQHLPSDYRPRYGVVWDMIADKDLAILQDPFSLQSAPAVVAHVWQVAADLGYGQLFIDKPYQCGIIDDHLPLLAAGLATIDVIDLDYGPRNSWHHSHQDTIDKLSVDSFRAVGDVAAALVTTGSHVNAVPRSSPYRPD